MIRVLLDTNVVLDLLLDRDPFAKSAAVIWQANEQKQIEGFISAITPVNVFYIARKLKGSETARQALKEILSAFEVCSLDLSILQVALSFPFEDYEDAVQHACAITSKLDVIVTRNTQDFKTSVLPVLSPDQFIQKYQLES